MILSMQISSSSRCALQPTIRAIAKTVGGGGGGRPSMAMAGGKNPAGVDEALKLAAETLKGQLGA